MSLNIFRKDKEKTKEKAEGNGPYWCLRQQVLELKPLAELLSGDKNSHPVYASVVDMDMGDTVVSLACAADGTTSLYFSTGGGQIGLGQKYEAVRMATIAFLQSSEQVLDKLTTSKEYPLPTDKKHIVYLVTERAVYKQEFEMDKVETYSRELKFLNFLYQNVLKEIGAAK